MTSSQTFYIHPIYPTRPIRKKKDKLCAFQTGRYAHCGKRVRFAMGFPSAQRDLREYYAHFSRWPELGANLDVYQGSQCVDRPTCKTEIQAGTLSSSTPVRNLCWGPLLSNRDVSCCTGEKGIRGRLSRGTKRTSDRDGDIMPVSIDDRS